MLRFLVGQMKNIKIIIFDADGTIFDSMPFTAKIFADVLERYSIPRKESKNYMYATAGNPPTEVFNGILKKHNKHTNEIKKIIKEFFDLLENSIPIIFIDVIPTLRRLNNYKKIISTNLRQDILNRRVQYHGLHKYFEKHLGTNGFKSKEEHFGEIKKIYKLSEKKFRKKVILVGDGKRDMELTHKHKIVGIGKVGIENAKTLKQAGATYIINNLSEIVKILKNGKIITQKSH